MLLRHGKLLSLITLLLTSQASFAEFVAVNSYHCTGKNITVDYSTSSFSGEPIINIIFGKKAFGGMGNTVMNVQTVATGNFVTVTRKTVPDAFTDSLSIMLPDANVPALGDTVAFKSQLISTRTHSSIAGPNLVNGLIQENRIHPLHCTATAVVF